MDELTLDVRNAEALRRCESRYLAPEAEGTACPVCGGTGVVPGTETETLWGTPCTEGCMLDIQRLRENGGI